MTPDETNPPDDVAPGWDAIDAALKPLYGPQQPRHFGTILNYRLGGPDPLDGISAYARAEPVPHWHILTYGFSELYEKEAEDQAISGYGSELTLRLSRDPSATDPPVWVLGLLQDLARYVFKTGNIFTAAHLMNLNGPIALDTPTALTAIAFMPDSELPPIDTPNGHLSFLQTVGANSTEQLSTVLPNRLLHGRALKLIGPICSVQFEPADHPRFSPTTPQSLLVQLPAAAVLELAAQLIPRTCSLVVPSIPILQLRIVPSHIRDQKGNVIKTIG